MTNPAIDSLREYRGMSLKTRFGNLKKRAGRRRQPDRDSVLDSPFVANGEFCRDGARIRRSGVIHWIAASRQAGGEDALRRWGLERIRAEAEGRCAFGARAIWC